MKNDYEDEESPEAAAEPSQSEGDTIESRAEVELGLRRELVKLVGDSEWKESRCLSQLQQQMLAGWMVEFRDDRFD